MDENEAEQLILDILAKLKSKNLTVKNKGDSMLRKLIFNYNSEQVYLIPTLLPSQQIIGSQLIANLNDKNPHVRYTIIDALKQLEYKPAILPLKELLQDADKEIRSKVAYTLGKLGERKLAKQAFIDLIRNLKPSRNDRKFGIVTVQNLQSFADEDTKYELERLLEADNWAIRHTVAVGLGLLKDNKAFESIIALLQSKEIMVRLLAIMSLSKLEDRRAIPYLIKMLNDKDDDVRLSAIYALGDFKAKEAIPALEKARNTDKGGNDWETIEEAAIEALKKIQ